MMSPAPVPFNVALRLWRHTMTDPKTGRKPISQERLSELWLLHKHAVYEYEAGLRMPHPLIRREIDRFFPGIFEGKLPAAP